MADSPGVSRSMDFQPYLDKGRQFVENLQNIVSKPIDIPIRVIGGDDAQKAIQALQPDMSPESAFSAFPPPNSGRILPQQPDLSLAPDPRRYHRGNAWDSPEDFPNAPPDGLAIRAHEGWDKIKSGGAYHTLQESGRFGRKWGTFLGGNEKDEQRDWADAAGTPEGKKFSESMEEVEKTGKKIATLLKEIGQGGPGAVKAAEELKKAQAALDELGKAGKAAADGLGGDMGSRLNAELEPLVKKAGAGKIPGETQNVNGATPQDILGMVRNPMGALQSGLTQSLLSGAAGLSPEILGAVGMGGAVAGGAYAGWKFNMARASDAVQDGLDMGDDVRMSRGAGRNFDFRGSYWNKDRNNANADLDTFGARNIIDSFGFGLGNWKNGDGSKGNPNKDMPGLTEKVLDYSLDNGVKPEAMAGAMGAAVTSGAVDKSAVAMGIYLQQMVGYLQRADANGVRSAESLHAIASLNSAQVQALGKLTDGASHFNMNLLEALDKTGDPALRGERGVGVLTQGFGHLSGNQVPMVFSSLLRSGKLNKLVHQRHDKPTLQGVDTSESDAILAESLPAQIEELKEDKGLVTAGQLMAWNDPMYNTIPMAFRRNLLGLGSVGVGRLRSMEKSPGLTPEKILAMGDSVANGKDPLWNPDPNEKSLSFEGFSAREAGRVQSRTEDGLNTGATMVTAERLKEASENLNEVSLKLSAILDKAQRGESSWAPDPFANPNGLPGTTLERLSALFGGHPYKGTRH